jgi:hypothetical protein
VIRPPIKLSALTFVVVVLGVVVLVGLGTTHQQTSNPPTKNTAGPTPTVAQATPVAPGDRLEVPPPPFSEGIFPCSTCHKLLTPNPTRRELQFHTEIVLKHDEEHRWCLDCHDATNRDVLHLANGDHVSFEESYKLCGQCHGEKLRDWKAGVHGRRTGYWNGEKQYLLCVNCHWPHAPHFKPIEPKPAPVRPTRPGSSK